MFCPKCGTLNADENRYCQNCQFALPEIHEDISEFQPQQRISKLAIWSLVLSLTVLLTSVFGSIAGLVCGIIGINKIRKSGGTLTGKRLAITGTILSVIHLFVFIPMIINISMPTMKQAISVSKRMMCENNMKVLSKAVITYTNEFDGKYPAPNWGNLLIEHADISEVHFLCPAKKQGPSNFAININAVNLNGKAPDDMVILFETKAGWNQIGGPEILTLDNHEGKGCNIAFADGHIEFVPAERINTLKWTVE